MFCYVCFAGSRWPTSPNSAVAMKEDFSAAAGRVQHTSYSWLKIIALDRNVQDFTSMAVVPSQEHRNDSVSIYLGMFHIYFSKYITIHILPFLIIYCRQVSAWAQFDQRIVLGNFFFGKGKLYLFQEEYIEVIHRLENLPASARRAHNL